MKISYIIGIYSCVLCSKVPHYPANDNEDVLQAVKDEGILLTVMS